MAAVNDPALRELEEAVREIQERVRARHPEGERGRFGVSLADLMPLVHARDAAEAKVAAIGTVNPRPPGLKNNLIQKWKRFIARVLDWHVREQVEFNRAQMNCVQAVMEALNEHNRSLERIAAALDQFSALLESYQSSVNELTGGVGSLPARFSEWEHRVGTLPEQLADIRLHWQEWRREWERKLTINETQFLRSAAELQSGFTHRTTLMEANYRDLAKLQHSSFESALGKATQEIQTKVWQDLDKIKTEYESLIHAELRSIRQKAFAAAAALPVASGAAPAADHEYDFLRFAEKYRGPESYVKANFEVYLPYLEKRSRIVDLGCGRGEMLELLREKGITAKGVDADKESVAICKSKSLDAIEADIFTFLEESMDGAFDGLFCAQVIEHLPPLELPRFIRLCALKLERGGVLILETPNPECLAIFATHFYMDPTHQRPVPPSLAAFHMEEAGLGRIEIKRLAPALESMPSLASLPTDFREAFFGCLDYGIVGIKLS